MATGSAAWVLGILAVATGLIGSLLLTVLDPVMQTLFASPLFEGSTSFSSNALGWLMNSWTYWPVFILLGILVFVWVRTRRPG